MADNTALNPGAGGDSIRDVDNGAGVKTQVILLNIGSTIAESFWDGTLPATNAALAAILARLADGSQKAVMRAGAKGAIAAADTTSTASGADHQPHDVILYDAAGNVIDPRAIRAIASGTDSISVPGIDVNLSTRATEATLGTRALEAGGNLAAIKAKTDNIPPLGQALAAASTPVVLTAVQQAALTPPAAIVGFATSALQTQPGVDIGDVTINNAAGAAAVNVQDAGNSLTVDAPVGTPVFARLSDGAAALAGQKTMALSLPVAIASDQASIPVAATLTAETVKVIGAVNQGTSPWVVGGNKTNNNAAPGATNAGVLNSIANDALPSYTEGNLIIPASDLRGVLRHVEVPMAALGFYSWQGITGVYNGLAANTPLWSLRWGDATRFGIILRVRVYVFTSTAATAASITERQLIIARAFTASDTGGTAATLTGNNQKMRTSMGTSLVTDMRIGAPITAGTRTLDAAPIATTIGWQPLLNTGMSIGGVGGVSTVAATSSAVAGGIEPARLWDAVTGKDHPIVLAQNEGVVVRIGAVQPTTAVQQTLVMIDWAEANKVY